MKNILIEVIINNQCNKRCQYCDLDFKNKSLSKENIDDFLFFLNSNKSKVNYFHINFFGWEPLLSFDKIKYFVENNKVENIKFSIWTNWDLFDDVKIYFLIKNNFKIQISIDNITWIKNYDFLSKYSNFLEINFINDPDYLDNSKIIFQTLDNLKFKQINFMPVFTTKKWGKLEFSKLLNLKKYVDKNAINDIMFYSYFNWFWSDLQFIFDTDLYFYNDLDSLLWLQKQYKKLPINLKENIKNISQNKILNRDLKIDDLIINFDRKKIIKQVLEIPILIWTQKQNLIINKILKNGA